MIWKLIFLEIRQYDKEIKKYILRTQNVGHSQEFSVSCLVIVYCSIFGKRKEMYWASFLF